MNDFGNWASVKIAKLSRRKTRSCTSPIFVYKYLENLKIRHEHYIYLAIFLYSKEPESNQNRHSCKLTCKSMHAHMSMQSRDLHKSCYVTTRFFGLLLFFTLDFFYIYFVKRT